MLNVFTLAQTINETSESYISAYEFHGSVMDAISEASYIIANEGADIADFMLGAEEAMVEAAVNNPWSLESISESVVGTAITKIKGLLEKLIKVVKGIIAKLKAFFFKFTGNTTKWLSTTEDRIKKNTNVSGVGDLVYTCHRWDVTYVTKKISSVTSQIASDEIMEDFDDFVEQIFDFVVDASYDKEEAENTMMNNDRVKEEFTDLAESMYDITASSFDNVPTQIAKRANGGEAVDRKLSEIGIATALQTVKNSKDTIDALKKIYEKMDKRYTKAKNDLERAEKKVADMPINKAEKDDSSRLTEDKAKRNEFITRKAKRISTYYTIGQSFINTIQNLNIRLMQDMVKEFMGALNKVAFYKEKKEK